MKEQQQQPEVLIKNDNDEGTAGDDKELTNKIYQKMDNTYPDGHRFFLHASSLSIDELGIDVSCEIPHWWNAILSELEQ